MKVKENIANDNYNKEIITLSTTSSLKISIITVCRNSEKYISETINSVISQGYKNIEYIIIDAKSSDSTVDIIKQNTQHISFWISEEDKGMYDAINKGLKKATGDYILVLNSDDVLTHENVIEDAVTEITQERLDYYYGNIVKVKDGKSKNVKLFNVTYSQLLLSTHGTFAPHPCFFISKKLNANLGGYNLAYKYASDYDYILRAFGTNGVKGNHLDLYVTKFRMHDCSITASGKIDGDRKQILLKHGYYTRAYLSRVFFYYLLWVYYKMINIGQKFR